MREGQKISYEIVADRRSGKSSADNCAPWLRDFFSPPLGNSV